MLHLKIINNSFYFVTVTFTNTESFENCQNFTQKNEYFCMNCGKKYNWKGNLRRHIKLECGRDPSLKCQFCNYVTKHKSSLLRHYAIHDNCMKDIFH